MWQAAGAFKVSTDRPDSLHYRNTKEMRWHLFDKKAGENIKYHFTGYCIWAPAVLIKGFHCLLCFLVDFASNVTKAEWKARKGHRRIRGLYAFYSLEAAAEAFELLIEHKPWCRKKQTTHRDACVLFYPELISQAWSTPLQLQHMCVSIHQHLVLSRKNNPAFILITASVSPRCLSALIKTSSCRTPPITDINFPVHTSNFRAEKAMHREREKLIRDYWHSLLRNLNLNHLYALEIFPWHKIPLWGQAQMSFNCAASAKRVFETFSVLRTETYWCMWKVDALRRSRALTEII